MDDGRIRCIAVDTPIPSQFSHEILNANPYAYLDDAPLEERRARAVEMRRILPESVLEEVGKLDPAAIEQVREEAWPDVRDADELHDVLHTLIAFPTGACPEYGGTGVPARPVERSSTLWQPFFAHLSAQDRAVVARVGDRSYWVAAERGHVFSKLFPEAHFAAPELRVADTSFDDALLACVTGWMSHLGPVTAGELGEMLGLAPSEVEKALLR